VTQSVAIQDTENGCMRLVKGSFRNGIIPHTKAYKDGDKLHFDWDGDPAHYDKELEVPVLVPKGATLCWHGASLHGSHANPSDRWRRAWAVHFVTEDATQDGSPEGPANSCANYDDAPRSARL